MLSLETCIISGVSGIKYIDRGYFSHFKITLEKVIKSLFLRRKTENDSIGTLFQTSITFRLILSVAPWFFIPLCGKEAFIKTNFGVLYILFFFQLQFAIDLVTSWASRSKFGLLSINRKVVLHFSSQCLFIFIFFSMMLHIGSFDIPTVMGNSLFSFSQFPFFLLCVLAVFCKDEIGPFDCVSVKDENLRGCILECTPYLKTIKELSRTIDILFSCALIIVLFLNNISLPIVFDSIYFLVKIFLLCFFIFWIHGTLPRYRSDQWLKLFCKVFLPISLCVFLISGFSKCLFG